MTDVGHVVLVRFSEPSEAYQALSVLKECDAEGRIRLESAAVVERTANGELRPCPSDATERFRPCLPRSTGDRPATSPPQGAVVMACWA